MQTNKNARTSSSFGYALIVYTVLYVLVVALTIWREYADLVYLYTSDREEFTLQMVLTLCINIIAVIMGILYTIPVTRRSPVTRLLSYIVIPLLFIVSMFCTLLLVWLYRRMLKKRMLKDDAVTFMTYIITKDVSLRFYEGRFYTLVHHGIAPLIVVAACIHYLVVYKTFKRLPS